MPIVVYLMLGSFEENKGYLTEPIDDRVLDVNETEFAGRRAVCALVEATGQGYFDAGTLRMSCLVDWGIDAVLLEAIDRPLLDFDATLDVAFQMLEALEPVTPLPVD